ncbi:MAG: hypothetical protein ACIARR_00670 [Phycisphaerales bacterium JB059]
MRRSRRVAVSVGIGVVSTWLVAWGIAYWHDMTPSRGVTRDLPEASFPGFVPEDWTPPIEHELITFESSTRSWVGVRKAYTVWFPTYAYGHHEPALAPVPVESRMSVIARFGWPMLAMEHTGHTRSTYDPTLSVVRWGIPLGGPELLQKPRVALPLRPVWGGFPVNSALGALAAYTLLSAPGAAARWNRKRRGRCAACGYDLRHLTTCPECGA